MFRNRTHKSAIHNLHPADAAALVLGTMQVQYDLAVEENAGIRERTREVYDFNAMKDALDKAHHEAKTRFTEAV